MAKNRKLPKEESAFEGKNVILHVVKAVQRLAEFAVSAGLTGPAWIGVGGSGL